MKTETNRPTDPRLIVDHLKTVASRLVEALNRQSASGLINRDILKLTGELQQALWLAERAKGAVE